MPPAEAHSGPPCRSEFPSTPDSRQTEALRSPLPAGLREGGRGLGLQELSLLRDPGRCGAGQGRTPIL